MARREQSGWSGVDDDRLRGLWKDGRSGAEIGEALGRSRSAVLGRLHRLGLSGQRKARGIPRATSPKRLKIARAKPVIEPREAAAAAPAPYAPGCWPAADSAVALAALNHRHCRWPVGAATGADQLFCGAVRPEKAVYCDGHAKAAYQKAAN